VAPFSKLTSVIRRHIMFLSLLMAFALAAPDKPVCKDGVCPVPVKTEPAKVAAKTLEQLGKEVDDAKVALSAATTAVNATQALLTRALTEVAGKQAAVDKATKALLDALNPPPPTPTPTPTPTPDPVVPPAPEPPKPAVGVSLVMVTSSNCPACVQSMPDVEKLKQAGIPVEVVNGDDAAVAAKWRAKAFPTWVVLFNGQECNPRQWTTGAIGFAPLKKWLDDIKASNKQ
jgi:hypothetical protein